MTRAALVAVQLEINAQVLASADAYRLHLEGAAARAVDSADRLATASDPDDGWDEVDARLVVFPEIAGHLALYALAPERARRGKTLSTVLAQAAVRRPLDVLRGIATTRLLDARHAVLAALAPDGERWWKSVFGPLAKHHLAYVVAGSYLRLGADGALTNASLLFGPDGRLLATTDKVNLVPGVEDGARGGLALHRGDAQLPIVDTAFGKLVTLIGYDAAREPATPTERFVVLGPRLAERGGVDVVANPAGTLGTQVRRSTLAESLPAAARFGVTAHLVGSVLDLAFQGTSEVVERAGSAVKVLGRAEHADRGAHVTALVTC